MFLRAFLFALAAAGPALAQCPGGRCLSPPAPVCEWRPVPGYPEQLALWQGDRQLGSYDGDTGRYWPLLDTGERRFGVPGEPPLPLPAGWEARPAAQNFGLDLSRLNEAPGHEFIVNGRRASRHEAFAAVADNHLTDDSGKLRLTLIGPAAECARVRQDLAGHPALAAQRDALLVQDYRPDDPIIAGLGFVTTGTPTIYLQKQDGQVLFRLANYPGPEALAGAIRKRRPDYDPAKDDDPTKPAPLLPVLPHLPRLPLWAWAAGAVILILLLKGGRRAADP